MNGFEWLEGSWATEEEEGRVTEEHWSAVHGNLMLGWNRTLEGEELAAYEHLQIAVMSGGTEYRASPQEQPTASFRLVEVEGQRAVFENPDHDFPQRIAYERDGDVLRARISGLADGEEASHEWIFHRQPLEPAREAQFTARELTLSAEISATPEAIYRAWTTVEGAVTFFAPAARIEAEQGGAFELYFMPEAPEGGRGSEGCFIVELVENRRIAYTWNFPTTLPMIRRGRTLVTIELEPIDGGRTMVTATQRGFRMGPVWDEGYAYFERAWGIVLERLEQSFSEGPVDWEAL